MEKKNCPVKGAAVVLCGGYLLAASVLGVAAESKESEVVASNQQATSVQHGLCSMVFPGNTEKVSEKMQIDGEDFELRYDAYISSPADKTVFMLLVAEYPAFVDEQFARMSLEAFLNGILTYNPNNQLLFAEMVLIQGYEALDFFIRSGATYFKGRALMIKNQLYLMAMECEVQSYDEADYNQFVNSFALSQQQLGKG